jgi:hypothetical protein
MPLLGGFISDPAFKVCTKTVVFEMAENVKFHQACCSGHIHIFISYSNSVSMKRKLCYLQALSCSLSPLQSSRFWMINKVESPVFRRLSCRSIFIFRMPSSFQECVRPSRYIIIDSAHAHHLLLTSNTRIRGIPSAFKTTDTLRSTSWGKLLPVRPSSHLFGVEVL